MSIETHPFDPFLPENARLLMLGTFPPAEKRWAMKFYYPNFTNDMWRIFGICFFGDKMHFVRQQEKTYDQDAIIPCSALVDGEYGEKDLCIGVPCVLGKGGIKKIIELPLNGEEKDLFKKSAEAVRKTNADLPA